MDYVLPQEPNAEPIQTMWNGKSTYVLLLCINQKGVLNNNSHTKEVWF